MHWFLNPPPSGSDETRPVFIANVILLTGAAVPVAVAGIVSLVRDRVLRPFGWTIVGTLVAYFVLGGKSYYALPVLLFALAAGAIPLDHWATRRRLYLAGAVFVTVGLAVLPISLPVLPLHTAVRHGVVKARGDYQSEVGWPAYVRLVERHAAGVDVIVADNYGEAGALEVFGSGLPPVASADVTMRYWRPQVAGRRALVVGYSRARRRLLQRLPRRRTHLHSGRQRRGRRADRALHTARHPRGRLAEHRRDAGLTAGKPIATNEAKDRARTRATPFGQPQRAGPWPGRLSPSA